MKIKLRVLKEAEPALKRVFNFRPFADAKLGYSLRKITKKLIGELETLEEARMDLVKEFAVLNEKGQPKLVLSPEGISSYEMRDQEGFNRKWEELLDVEIEIDVWQIPFRAVLPMGLSLAQLASMETFITDSNDEAKKEEPAATPAEAPKEA